MHISNGFGSDMIGGNICNSSNIPYTFISIKSKLSAQQWQLSGEPVGSVYLRK